jgi:hypothetical protein
LKKKSTALTKSQAVVAVAIAMAEVRQGLQDRLDLKDPLDQLEQRETKESQA